MRMPPWRQPGLCNEQRDEPWRCLMRLKAGAYPIAHPVADRDPCAGAAVLSADGIIAAVAVLKLRSEFQTYSLS